jgi:hypothetical protein
VLLLLDECVPRRFARDLAGLDARHVVDMGWSGVKNGRLLQLMIAAGFDGLVTTDTNLARQQSITGSGMYLVVVRARSNRIDDLRPLATEVLRVIAFAQPGRAYTVGA